MYDADVNQLVRRLGDPLKASGGKEVRFNCPFCFRRKGREDTKAHLFLNPRKKVFFCQRCHAKGTLSMLFKWLGITLSEQPSVRRWGDMIRALRAMSGQDYREAYDPDEVIDYPCDVLRLRPGSFPYRYLTGRRGTTVRGLACRGLTPPQVGRYRFCQGTGWWADRLFIPTYGANGLAFWTARDLSGEADAVKYLHPKNRLRRYHVFGLEQAREYDDVIITEGPFDAIAAGPNGVAIYGSFASDSQLRMLRDGGFRRYYVALDPDVRTLAADLAGRLEARGMTAFLVSLPAGEDPASVGEFDRYLDAAVPVSFAAQVKFRLGVR